METKYRGVPEEKAFLEAATGGSPSSRTTTALNVQWDGFNQSMSVWYNGLVDAHRLSLSFQIKLELLKKN